MYLNIVWILIIIIAIVSFISTLYGFNNYILTFLFLLTEAKTPMQFKTWKSYTYRYKFKWFWLYFFKRQKSNQTCSTCINGVTNYGPFCSNVFGIEGYTSEIGETFWCKNYKQYKSKYTTSFNSKYMHEVDE